MQHDGPYSKSQISAKIYNSIFFSSNKFHSNIFDPNIVYLAILHTRVLLKQVGILPTHENVKLAFGICVHIVFKD